MKEIKKLAPVLALSLLAAPILAFAQNLENLRNLVTSFGDIVGLLVPILVAVAVLVFIFGVVKFIVNANDAEKRKEGGRFMIFAVIGIFVIVSLFGLVRFLQSAFGIDGANTATDSDVPTVSNDSGLGN